MDGIKSPLPSSSKNVSKSAPTIVAVTLLPLVVAVTPLPTKSILVAAVVRLLPSSFIVIELPTPVNPLPSPSNEPLTPPAVSYTHLTLPTK